MRLIAGITVPVLGVLVLAPPLTAAAEPGCTQLPSLSDSARAGFMAAAYRKEPQVTLEVLAAAGCSRRSVCVQWLHRTRCVRDGAAG